MVAPLAIILSRLRVRDERIFTALCSVFDEDEAIGAKAFAAYGDERALPKLASAIACSGREDSQWTFGDLIQAYEKIGGHLPEDLQLYVDELREEPDEEDDG